MAVFKITTTTPAMHNGELVEKFEEVVRDGVTVRLKQLSPINTSCRESRAKRHARKLREDGFRSVMLFKKVGTSWLPVTFKRPDFVPAPSPYRGHEPNCNSVMINLHPENDGDEAKSRIQTVNVRMNQLARKASHG